ncbi:MAG TPA: outer membrane beta-barrel protein [Bacteroidota bacterium]|nr:outer membrane beta-barrel protein [Bacteroidota bacterium]
MKKLAIIAATLLVSSSTLLAASPVRFGLQATGANINVPKPMNEIYGFGYGGGVHIDFNLPVLLSFRLQGDYVRFSADQSKYQQLLASLVGGTVASDFSIEGGAISVWSVYANVKSSFLPLPLISPYITGGAGIANLSSADATVKYQGQPLGGVPGVSGESKFSANLGAGVDLKIGIELYLEARYTWIFTSGETSTYVPISIGITL